MLISVIRPAARMRRPGATNTTKTERAEIEIASPISDRDLAGAY